MKRSEFEVALVKAARARRSEDRRSMLKRAYYSFEALPRGFRTYAQELYPINPAVADLTTLTLPKAVRDRQRVQAAGVMRASGGQAAGSQAPSVAAQPMAWRPQKQVNGMLRDGTDRMKSTTNRTVSAVRDRLR